MRDAPVAIDARLLPFGKEPVIKRSRRVGRKPSQFHCLTRSARTVCRNYRQLAYKPASNFDSPVPPVAATLFGVRSDGTP